MQEVVIIDYGMGNLHSVQKAISFLGAQPILSQDAEQIASAQKLILPGVGAFGDAMDELHKRDLVQAIKAAVQKGTPLMGICLGMQLLFESSTEGGKQEGFGFIPGEITKFNIQQKVPHMGWNSVENRDKQMFAGLPKEFSVYFVHSFCAQDIHMPYASGITEYEIPFVCAVHRKNIYGCQFHPEKSGENGMQILRNFLAVEGEKSC